MTNFWFEFLWDATLKALVLLSIAALAVRFCRSQSAALRHLIWGTAVVSATVLPLVQWALPVSQVGSPAPALVRMGARAGSAAVQSLDAFVINAGTSSERAVTATQILFSIWLVGVVVSLCMLGLGTVRLAWTARRSEPVLLPEWMRLCAELSAALGVRRPVRLLLHGQASMPITWGLFQPRVLLPAEALSWTAERRRIVLSHELAHIRRRDWAVQTVAEAGRAIFWFHPLFSLGCNRLRQESEQACDDAVLLSGIHAPVYAEHLLDLAQTLKSSEHAWYTALAMARQCHLERRFIAMLNPTLNRRQITKSAAFLTTAAACVFMLALGTMRTPAQSLAGKFFGTVYDPSGAAVPNATVIATNPEARTKDMTTSNAAGVFEFPTLPAATYTVEVLKPGFAKFTASVNLEPNQSRHEKVPLQVGSVQEQVQVTATGPAGTQAPAPTQIRIGGNVQATKLVHKVTPTYPTVAKAAGIQGSVMLEAIISKEGTLLSLRVMNSQIDPDLARAAVEAVNQWRYQPTLLNGVPVEIRTRVDINFTLLP